MKRIYLLAVLFVFLTLGACSMETKNPFFTAYDTPFGVPPFEKISEDHYLPAFKEGIKRQQNEIILITGNTEPPAFENTVEALEKSGALLQKVSDVFYNLTSSNTNERMQDIAKEVAPLLSQNRDDIRLNDKLFKRLKTVYEQRDQLQLSTEQYTVLEKYFKDFVRGGANLGDQQKTQLREINKELSLLSLKFGDHILKENNSFELVIENKQDLQGLPEAVIAASASTAEERGHTGKWVFTLHKPSLIPFLQYSQKRELRELLFKGYINRGDNDNELDNKDVLARIAALRIEKAQLLGYESHADFILERTMAQNPQNVYKLLEQLWEPALKIARSEAAELQKLIKRDGHSFNLQPWDWWYYAEKLKKEKYALDDELLRPYFQLENVRSGAFSVATKLFGIQFEKRTDIPVYHEEVEVFEVKEADGSHIGLLFTDYFPRASKGGGAWMNAFRKQSRLAGKDVTPLICNVCNFSKPTADKPALLSFDEVTTLFHEFGHALHGLLSDRTYPRITGTSVTRDFVELPSQIMENWAAESEVLKMYARHYKTGEIIPDDLIAKIEKSGHFNQGFVTVEYLAASFLDLDWHTLAKPTPLDVREFETKSLNNIGLIDEIVVRYRSPYFSHIFDGGYSSGYYSYIWAEVLDADAFQAFKETSLFDKETALAFRKNILEAGGSEDAMELYKRFRGAEPKVGALLKRRGLN